MDRRTLSFTLTIASLTIASLTIAALATGCTLDHGQVYTTVAWPEARERLGRVAVLPVRCPDHLSEKAHRITQLSEAAFRKLPEAEIVAAEPLASELALEDRQVPFSDYDLVMAARKLNIDTVCSLTVSSYTVSLTIGLVPFAPLWHSCLRIEYDMRLIDVSSGKLLLETSRLRIKELAYAGRWRRDLDDEFSKDLEWVLAEQEKFDVEEDSPIGLPRVSHRKSAVSGKTMKSQTRAVNVSTG